MAPITRRRHSAGPPIRRTGFMHRQGAAQHSCLAAGRAPFVRSAIAQAIRIPPGELQ